ncbi:GTPase HflX [Aquisalimonas lutea]|uniref:ribosome rescue GTPase HflX n=1 Tax=Aquisalimonas lutea TaxID=1327750 RepID=UPI0025B293BC|nr:ribosome rescue GTPase HflX [Aquisalimonas lutea]MDN3519299.1 GTPase HflX [Aquisalimonas lutea]
MATSELTGPAASALNLFDRPEGGERALLVHLDTEGRGVADALEELRSLAESAGAEVVDTFVSRRKAPDPRYYIGSGKVDELAALVASGQADLVLLNHVLSPSQERNLEQALRCRVLDRTGLILDIFAQRARTHEGKLQVELAQLRHMATRLVRGWSHLERQKGGIGQRGPGETQLEMDRRMLGVRIKQLEKRIARVRQQREQGRQARRKQEVPTVSLVGYTNAGKSTLFNQLTQAGVYADDRLFATLDTTLRRVLLATGEPFVLADTVGFIRELPHQLVAAFRSTLEEATESQLLVHVIDAGDDNRDASIGQVESVLDAIGAGDIPRIRVYNKIDRTAREPGVSVDPESGITDVRVSAADGRGMDLLLAAIADNVAAERVRGRVSLRPEQGRLRSRFFDLGEVIGEDWTESGELVLEIDIRRRDLDHLYEKEGLTAPLQSLPQ